MSTERVRKKEWAREDQGEKVKERKQIKKKGKHEIERVERKKGKGKERERKRQRERQRKSKCGTVKDRQK